MKYYLTLKPNRKGYRFRVRRTELIEQYLSIWYQINKLRKKYDLPKLSQRN